MRHSTAVHASMSAHSSLKECVGEIWPAGAFIETCYIHATRPRR